MAAEAQDWWAHGHEARDQSTKTSLPWGRWFWWADSGYVFPRAVSSRAVCPSSQAASRSDGVGRGGVVWGRGSRYSGSA